ncbi:MAG: hypothetical protein ACYC7J_08110 [Syntrophales bacterium]
MKAKCTIVLSMVLFLFVFGFAGPMGCGDSQTPAKSPRLQGDESPFSGGLLKDLLTGLWDGASGEIGGDAMGLILNLLGWGGGGGDDQQDLAAMSQKLDEIVSLLSDIENRLDALLKQLKITEEEILANTNDPSNAITQIDSSHQELQGLSKKGAGSVDQATLANFTNRAENVYNVYEQVNAIHDAIVPPTIAKTPVLNNFADLALNKGNSLTDSYLGLEQYFAQLLYYQMEGVNLIVETKTYRKKAGLPQIDGREADEYMNFFTSQKLQPEVDNFMSNVHRLILNHVDLVDSAGFLPADAESVLSRANFFRAQALNQDHFGLRGNLIATQDLVSSIRIVHAQNIQTGNFYDIRTGTLSTVTGKAYDSWQGNSVKGSSDYTVVSYDFGALPLGDYRILNIDMQVVIGHATVQAFKDDYTADPSGTIAYGHFVLSQRVGAKDAFNNNASWIGWTKELHHASSNVSASDKQVSVTGSNQNDSYSGEAELDANFIYSGTADAGFTINYSAHAYGTTSSSSNVQAGGNANSTIQYTLSIWDKTTGRVVSTFTSPTKTTGDNGSASIDDRPQGSWYFPNPSPGHNYYIVFYCRVGGDSYYGRSGGNVTIDSIAGNVYITF